MNDDKNHKPRKLLVLDVDGVIFNGQFLLHLARRIGIIPYLKTLWRCILFDQGRLSLEQSLARIYGGMRGAHVAEIWSTYMTMPLSENCRETVAAARSIGYYVALVTSGVPDFLVEGLGRRLGADGGWGMHIDQEHNLLSGEVSGELATSHGKLQLVERLREELSIERNDVTVVGDDRNNLEIMERAGTSIGFRSTLSVRRRVDWIVDSNDLSEILPYLGRTPPDPALELRYEPALPVAERPWHREIRRKLVHGVAVAVPSAFLRFPNGVYAGLFIACLLYMLAEFVRLNGADFPFIGRVTRWVLRRYERRTVATGPVTLALGILLSLIIFERRVASAAIFTVALSDSLAAIVGERWGRHRIPYNRAKTLEGSAVFFVMAVVCGFFYFPLWIALLAAGAATAVESLRLEAWDNFFVPLATGSVVMLALWAS